MITARERELLEWIEQNPLISQQELAARANITRSSVAVHISNLIKKGYIQGKGYVLKKAPYVCVVGGANIDITGRAGAALALTDSTPGHVATGFGGVGRNQAHNLRLLGVDVKFISAFGEDFNGERLRRHCQDIGIDIRECLSVPTGRTSSYVSVIDESGKLQAGISDMDIYEHLSPDVLEWRKNTINQAAVCVADTNIPQSALAYLAQNAVPPLFVETISRAKVKRVAGILGRLHTLKTDQTEAPCLLGCAIETEEDIRRAVTQLLEQGVQNVFMHLPAQNEVVCASGKIYLKLAYRAQKLISKNGARDSFMAALIWARIQGLGFEAAAKAGVAAASLCAATPLVVNSELSSSYLMEAAQEN